ASAVASFDARGTFVGSSLISATARDYARLGLLYQRGGECNGQRIVSSSWVDFVRTPAPASGGTYGAHFWIGPHSKALREDAALMATWPKDEFSAGGLFGQVISIAPSKKLVLVMLGHTQYADAAERATLRDRQLARLYAALAGGSN
ncbi:MAG: serine hydrolase, partial [Rhodoferax sp.]